MYLVLKHDLIQDENVEMMIIPQSNYDSNNIIDFHLFLLGKSTVFVYTQPWLPNLMQSY